MTEEQPGVAPVRIPGIRTTPSKFRARMGDFLARVQYGKETIVIVTRGKRVAVLCPPDNWCRSSGEDENKEGKGNLNSALIQDKNPPTHFSETTHAIIRLTEEYGATIKRTKPDTIRIYVGKPSKRKPGNPIMRLRKLTKGPPEVVIRCTMQTLSRANDATRIAHVSQLYGIPTSALKARKGFPASFLIVENPLETLRVALPRIVQERSRR